MIFGNKTLKGPLGVLKDSSVYQDATRAFVIVFDP